MTIAEIEAAIDALAPPDQLQLYSDLTAKLFQQTRQASVEQDPFAKLLDELEKEPYTGEPTNVAANYKEYLYGYGSDE